MDTNNSDLVYSRVEFNYYFPLDGDTKYTITTSWLALIELLLFGIRGDEKNLSQRKALPESTKFGKSTSTSLFL